MKLSTPGKFLLRKCGREDLIGNTQGCLVRPKQFQSGNGFKKPSEQKNSRSDRPKNVRIGKATGKSSQNQADHRKNSKTNKKDFHNKKTQRSKI